MTDQPTTTPTDENSLIAERRGKLTALRGQGIAYPNDFTSRGLSPAALQAEFADAETVDRRGAGRQLARQVKLAGRLMAKRVMGKASFAQVQDESGRIQLFLQGAVRWARPTPRSRAGTWATSSPWKAA